MSIRDNLGGGSAAKINVLDTLEEIEANTDPGKPAGALAIKEISNNLGGLRFGSDGEGNVGYFGADGSLVPFKFNLENVNIEFKTAKHPLVVLLNVEYLLPDAGASSDLNQVEPA